MRFVNKIGVLALAVLFSTANLALALSPPAPKDPKITIHESPDGSSIILLPSYDNKKSKYSFYSSDQLYRLSLDTVLPREGQKIGYEFELSKSYICSGTALVVSSVFDDVIAMIYPPPAVSFSKLIVQLNEGYCKWTDGLLHIAVVQPFSGILEINNSGVIDPDLDLRLENAALRAEIEKLLSENAKLLKETSSLEAYVKNLSSENESLKADLLGQERQITKLGLLVSNVSKAFVKAKPNNFSSLKALHASLKKLLNDQSVAKAKK